MNPNLARICAFITVYVNMIIGCDEDGMAVGIIKSDFRFFAAKAIEINRGL